jgi:hypothetical protein
MPEKKKHHFVPRFYLSAFRSAPKRIHLFGVDSSRAIQDVGIRDQCHRHRFHGPRNNVEDALGRMEDRAARAIRPIDADGLPKEDTDEFALLLLFVAFQWRRTAKVADGVLSFADKLSKQIGSRADGADGLEWLNSPIVTPALVALRNAPNVVLAISDLRCHLVVPETGSFVTSDHPVFSYNQYCEGIDYRGITGALSKGLQIFVPLSPRSLLVLFDDKVYKVVKSERRPHRSIASAADVAMLNSMQLLSAHPNVYFSDWDAREALQRLTESIRAHRETAQLVVQEYGHDTDPNRSILHSFERMPNLKLNLSFLKVRWDARSTPLASRAPALRREMPMPDLPDMPSHLRGPATFSRFMGRQ